MSDEPMLSPRMTLLGEAMRPVWEKVQAEIDQRVPQAEVVVGMGAVVLHHFQSLRDNVPCLADRINRLMDDVVTNEAAGDAEVYRAVGRFEAFLDDLLTDYRSVRALNAYDDDMEARDLLAGVYRHTLVEIRDWLAELVETLADPMSAVIKQGLPTTGYVKLKLNLTLTAAPQLGQLSRWAERHASALPRAGNYSGVPPARKSGLGIWGWGGAALLGWWIGGALAGDDDCGCDGDD
jgi:hypothetical protein